MNVVAKALALIDRFVANHVQDGISLSSKGRQLMSSCTVGLTAAVLASTQPQISEIIKIYLDYSGPVYGTYCPKLIFFHEFLNNTNFFDTEN